MLLVLTLLLLPGLLTAQNHNGKEKWAPFYLDWNHYFPDYNAQIVLLHLTEAIVKDVEIKSVMSDYIQSSYHGSFDYEIGYMAAATKDLFRHMLSLYRKYSKPAPYANRTTNSAEYLDVLHKIQGDYREILIFKDMYVKTAVEEGKRQDKARQILRFQEMRKKTQETVKIGDQHLSREADVPEERKRPSKEPGFDVSKRTLKPWQVEPMHSKEWDEFKKQNKKPFLRNSKDRSGRSEHESKKKQEEEKYKALLRENYKTRRGEPVETGF